MRFLFNAQFHWPFGDTAYAAAAALRMRGHDAAMVVCGHLPDYCEQENLYSRRPDCGQCARDLRRQLSRYDLPHLTMSETLTLEDLREARAIVAQTSADALRNVGEMDVPVGHIAYLNLFQYLRGIPAQPTPRLEEIHRRCLTSAILITRAAHRLIDRYAPDVVVTVNGKFAQWAPFIHAARQRGLRFITWEDINTSPISLVQDQNHIAHEMSPWFAKEELSKPFPEAHKQWARRYFADWDAQKNTPFPYYDNRRVDAWEAIRHRLGLREGRPLIGLFPNLGFDSSSVDFERAFTGIFDWILRTIDYAANRPELDFVIRVHPAEEHAVKDGDEVKRTETLIAERFPQLPQNVRVAGAESGISSYTLIERAAAAMVYTGTLGLEMALRGKRPWVVGRAYYGGLGFTRDIETAEQLWSLLDANRFDGPLNEAEIEMVERVVYLTRRRWLAPIPYFSLERGFTPASLDVLKPGGSAYFDRLCELYTSGAPFLDLGEYLDEPLAAE